MSISLEQLADDIRAALKFTPGRPGRERAAQCLARVLTDEAFKAQYIASQPPNGPTRVQLYEDPELGFCICAHIFDSAYDGTPHDHGPGWTIYGQASGETEMTEWRTVEKGEGGKPTLVEPDRTYLMKVGDTAIYDVGTVHSSRREGPTWLVRIESQNMATLWRSNIKAA